jgi:two-component system OmpR family sensor kinase
MKRQGSLQRRLALGLGFGIAIMWLGATLVAGFTVRHELDEAFDSAIQETAQRVLPLAVVDIINREGPIATQRIPLVRAHEEYLTYVVRDDAGNTLLRSHDADPAVFPPIAEQGFTETATHRLYTETAVQGTIVVTVAEPLAHRRQAVLQVLLALALPLLVLVPASVAGVWCWVRLSLRPVHGFRGEIETRGHGDLTPIGTGALPEEVSPIADAVNRLMERLRRALEAERSFAANSAHELRTPVAAALAQAQRLMAEASDPPVQDRARQIESSLRALARITEKLMQLAKAEGAGVLSETEHDLVPVISLVADEFRRADESSRLRLSLPDGPFLSKLDADAFAILIRNLIENAIRHGATSEPVTVSLSEQGVLSVANGGPAVPQDALARLTQPFERSKATSPGYGLGLAIAEAIATGAGTRLELRSPIPGADRGFEANVRLPRDAAPLGGRR